MLDFPLLVFVICLVILWLSAQAGSYSCRRRGKLSEDERADLGIILAATLTLLALIIGFTFSMAITRYDRRQDDEAAEANAIGTEFDRVGMLDSAGAAGMRQLLRDYLDQRVLFYTTRNTRQLEHINVSAKQLQNDLWAAILDPRAPLPSPVLISGMNDVFNTQRATQAAWWNRIPLAAWAMMVAIAICCNCLVGYTARRSETRVQRYFVLPLIVSISFFLIADIDSPRGGLIRVRPQNLESLSSSLNVTLIPSRGR